MKKITVSSPGKILLLGEHSVVYGNYALAASLSSLRTEISLNYCHTHTIEVCICDFVKNQTCLLSSISFDPSKLDRLFESKSLQDIKMDMNFGTRLQTELNIDIPQQYIKTIISLCYLLNTYCHSYCVDRTITIGFQFKICSKGLPIGAGLGSSASVSCCLSLLIYYIQQAFNNTSFTLDSINDYIMDSISWSTLSDTLCTIINKYAYECECIFHGTPSGVDNTICLMGHALLFKKGEFEIKNCPSLKLLIINTNAPKNTKEMVSQVRQFYTLFPEVVKPLFESINQQILYVLKSSTDEELYDHLSNVMNMCHNILISLNVSHPQIELCRQLIQEILQQPSKLTGAGGGGCLYTILPTTITDDYNKQLNKLLEKLSELHMTYYITNISGNGLMYHFD